MSAEDSPAIRKTEEAVEEAAQEQAQQAQEDAINEHRGDENEKKDAVINVDADASTNTPTSSNSMDRPRKRAVQIVSTHKTRLEVIKWMLLEDSVKGDKSLVSRACAAFPEVFHGNRNANIQKCSRWWHERESILAQEQEITGAHGLNSDRLLAKAGPGRGRKRSKWVEWLHPQLLAAVELLRKDGEKFDIARLKKMALDILENSNSDFSAKTLDADGTYISSKITTRWVQSFMERYQITIRTQTVAQPNATDDRLKPRVRASTTPRQLNGTNKRRKVGSTPKDEEPMPSVAQESNQETFQDQQESRLRRQGLIMSQLEGVVKMLQLLKQDETANQDDIAFYSQRKLTLQQELIRLDAAHDKDVTPSVIKASSTV